MSTDSLSASPIGFSIYSTVAAGLSFVIAALYGLPVLISIYTNSLWFLFAVIFLVAFSLAKSQDIAKRQDLYAVGEDVRRRWKIFGLMINVFYTNLVLFAAVAIGEAIVQLLSAEPGLFVASLVIPVYGFWEIETRSRGLPVSIGGSLLWIIAFVYIIAWGTSTLLQRLRNADWEDTKQRLGRVREEILRVMSLSEESPIHSTADRFSR